MDFEGLEAIEREGHDLAGGRFLNGAGGLRRVEAMDEPRGKTHRLQFCLIRLVQLAKAFRDLQGVVFFSP